MQYERPEVAVVKFANEDVIFTSGIIDAGQGDFSGGGNADWDDDPVSVDMNN